MCCVETGQARWRKGSVTRSLRFRATEYPGGLQQPPHAHGLQISLVLHGSLQESVGGAVATARALSIGVKDAGVVHADRFGPERVAIAQLSLPTGNLAELIDSDDRASDWRWIHASAVARPFLRIVTRAANGTDTFAIDDTDVVDLVASLTARRAEAVNGAPPRWLADAVDELRATWRAGIRVSDVATRVGVHPVYLARCFRRWYGHGVSDELRSLRQRAAAEAIANGRQTLSAIAHASGYADESHLSREFRAMAGSAPGHFRRALRKLRFHPGSANVVARIQA
jgi:AraC family transcriptional regulator